MNARVLFADDLRHVPSAPTVRPTDRTTLALRRLSPPIDLDGARAYFEDPVIGPVTLWLIDAKPRRSATIVPVPGGAWEGERLVARIEERVAALQAAGVAVLLVDMRACSLALRWLGAVRGARSMAWWRVTDEPFVGAALRYLEERGFDPDDVAVDRVA
jgi:hypothetical protein